MRFPSFFSKKFLGIDVGTSAVKLVELSRKGERKRLENYGEVKSQTLYEKPFRAFERNTLSLSSEDIAKAVKAILEEGKIKTRDCIFSIPDFSSFFTTFDLPPMTKDELPQAVEYEARQHVPLPLSEVALDWQVIEESRLLNHHGKTKIKILLVAVPNGIIDQYQEIARFCGLQLKALEAEVFGLIHSLVPDTERRVVSIVDIGAQSTTCSIIEKRILKSSNSFDLAANGLISQVASSLSIDSHQALELCEKYGLQDPSSYTSQIPFQKSVKEILIPLIDMILREIERISRQFLQNEGKEIQKYIIAGGAALLPGLREYFQNYFKKEVEIGNPFADIFYPPILEETIRKIGPSYAIAAGMAQRGLQ